jgi:hypothetical protein
MDRRHRHARHLLAGVLVLLAGCGSSASTSQTTRAQTSAHPTSSPLDAWLVTGDEEPGYVAAGTTADNTVQQFVAPEPNSQRTADAAQLRENGFRSAATENLNATRAAGNGAAISLVIELGSPAAAKREAAGQLRSAIAAQGSGAPIKRFTVAGVPGASGFTASLPGSGAANVVFVEGSCVLLIGDFNPPGSLTAPLHHAVVAVYRRTHGTCP